jgi:outer membrane protein insertion porin family
MFVSFCGSISMLGAKLFFRRGVWPARACALAFFLLFSPIAGAYAQKVSDKAIPKTSPLTEEVLSSYEGQKVTVVAVAGRPDVTTAQYQSVFLQKSGTPFSEESVRQTVEALKKAAHTADVQIQVSPQGDGLRVLFVLEPAISFGLFQFPGAERFSYSRLVQVANYPPQAPFNADDIQQDQNSLLKFFRQEGYFQSEVTPEVKIDAVHKLANVNFHVTLGKAARFGVVDIQGPPAEESAKLNASLKKLMARLRGAGIRSGKAYHRSTLTKATQYLTRVLEKEDRLNAQVRLAGAEYHADTNRADIHFKIRMGQQTEVKIDGAHLFSWTKNSLLPIYQGVGVDDESVEEGRQALISYFQRKGYFDTTVDVSRAKTKTGRTLVYKIDKQKKHKVTEVDLKGNKALKDDDLYARITVEEKHFFGNGKFSEKLVRDSVKNLEAVYQSEGFSDVKVTPKILRDERNIQVRFIVTEGPRDIVSSLKIEGADTFPESDFAPKGLKLGVGKPYSQALVQADRANIVAQYLRAGYLTSSFREKATIASKSDPHHINVVYQIYEGPRVFADELLTLGRSHTSQRLIDEDTEMIKPGAPLTETDLLTAESRLYDHTGVFDWAEVDPKEQITTQTKEDVLVKVHEAKRNQITYGIGFEVINRGGSVPGGTVVVPGLPPVGLPTNFKTSQATFYGPRGTFQYTRNNLRGKGESLSFTAFAGRLDQRLAIYYINPRLMWTRWRATASISGEINEENPIYSSRQELASYQVQRDLDKAKHDSLFLRYAFSKVDLTHILFADLVLPADQHVRLSTVAANLTRDTRDNPVDEHKGVLDTVELDLNTTKLGSSVDFVKLNTQAAYYKQVWKNIVFANSLRIGLAQPFNNSRVPISEAFFAGGGNSLRGFPLDGAGPQRQVEVCPDGTTGCKVFINVPSGGNELLVINTEARIPMPFKKGLSIVPFYDGGNIFPRVGFHEFTSLYSNNVGLGLRYSTPIGPVRIDVGRNLNPIDGIKATNYFISIGQAF